MAGSARSPCPFTSRATIRHCDPRITRDEMISNYRPSSVVATRGIDIHSHTIDCYRSTIRQVPLTHSTHHLSLPREEKAKAPFCFSLFLGELTASLYPEWGPGIADDGGYIPHGENANVNEQGWKWLQRHSEYLRVSVVCSSC